MNLQLVTTLLLIFGLLIGLGTSDDPLVSNFRDSLGSSVLGPILKWTLWISVPSLWLWALWYCWRLDVSRLTDRKRFAYTGFRWVLASPIVAAIGWVAYLILAAVRDWLDIPRWAGVMMCLQGIIFAYLLEVLKRVRRL